MADYPLFVLRRPEHFSQGDPCVRCGWAADKHRAPRKKRGKRKQRISTYVRPKKIIEEPLYLGIDGEGQGRDPHRYMLLAVASECGDHKYMVSNQFGLSTKQCLDFILSIQTAKRLFAYSFNYDLTKILADVDNSLLYKLFRPELRNRKGKRRAFGPRPVEWEGYSLNLIGTKFTVSYTDNGIKTTKIVWDIWKFYQSKFVNALQDWKVGPPEAHERMQRMKSKRADFDRESFEDIKNYCLEECRYMAELARKLVEAHHVAGLKLQTFYGAGSSAAAMLKKMGVKRYLAKPPDALREIVTRGFFGGRFENSVIGTIDEPVYNYDISSAYPYQLCFLPCLVHGRWEHTTNRNDIERATTAIVRYSLRSGAIVRASWGPFPFRERKTGNICFPAVSGGGWVWKNEYLAGERLFPNVGFKEAWIYRCDCECKPFADIPSYYCERIRIGKEGPGIVIKLACNSCYGKLAQSVGAGQFNSWVWAGLTTSGCRAQLLEFLGLHNNWADVLMMATDGIFSRQRIIPPVPHATGTLETGKPLGGWEEKVIDKGVFIARPGIYFPLNPTVAEIKTIRGRGIGKSSVLENWARIIDSWTKEGLTAKVQVNNVQRFHGAKTSISRMKHADGYWYNRAPMYGEWSSEPVELDFNPMPKRASVAKDGRTLTLRRLDEKAESAPYRKASLIGLIHREHEDKLEEQPI